VLGDLAPLIFGLVMIAFFSWECFGRNSASPDNERRQVFYNRWFIVWPVKPVYPRAMRRFNGYFFIISGCLFVAVGVILLIFSPN
jgi:hypothetical protein